MFKHLIRARSILAILSVAFLLTVPTQTSKADAASCAVAMAEVATAETNMQAACRDNGTQSGACNLAMVTLASAVAEAAGECHSHGIILD